MLLLASCKDEGTGKDRPDELVTFSAEITGFATRASQDGYSWNDEDRIGTFMFDAGMSTTSGSSANISYTASQEGRLVTFDSQTPLSMPKDRKPVGFMAYYPYKADIQNFVYPVRLADQENGSSGCDLMHTVAAKEYRYDGREENRVPLNFSHQLTKVILRFMDDNRQPLDVGRAVIEGMLTSASFDLTSARLTPEGSEEDIVIHRNPETGFYEAVLLPAAILEGHKVSFTTADKPSEWLFTDTDINLPELRKGTRYTFTIRIVGGQITGPAVVEIDGENSSFPWGDGETTTGTAQHIVHELFPEGEGAFADTELTIAFNGPAAVLGTRGYIRIYNVDDNTLVDQINMSERQVGIVEGTTLNSWMDIVGVTPKASTVNRKRVVNYHPVRIEGNTVIIKPHQQRLKPGTRYYVTIDKTAIVQADFSGIYANKWLFTTRQQPVPPTGGTCTVKVSHTDPNADFYTVQGAIDWFAANVDRGLPKTVNIDNGIYKEIIYLRD